MYGKDLSSKVSTDTISSDNYSF